MSKRTKYISGSKRSFEQGRLAALATKKTITNNIRSITAQAFIPSELLSEVDKRFAVLAAASTKDAAGDSTLSQKDLNRRALSDKDYPSIAKLVTYQMQGYQQAYYAFYVALINAMDELLQNPDQPATKWTKVFARYTPKKDDFGQPLRDKKGRIIYESNPTKIDRVKDQPYSKQLTLRVQGLQGNPHPRITLKGSWAGLTEFTLQEKEKLGYQPTYWKHTKEASRAFSALAAARISAIKPRDFYIRKQGKTLLVAGSSGTKGARKRVAAVEYELGLGVPVWNQKMDVLITDPFANGVRNSTQTSTGIYYADASGKPRVLHGIDRILVAEAYRPWLRNLSVAAGKSLQSYLKKGVASAPGTSAYAQGRVSAEKRAEAARKKANKAAADRQKARDKAAAEERQAAQRAADKAAKKAAEKAKPATPSSDAKINQANKRIRARNASQSNKTDAFVERVMAMADKAAGRAKDKSPTPAAKTSTTKTPTTKKSPETKAPTTKKTPTTTPVRSKDRTPQPKAKEKAEKTATRAKTKTPSQTPEQKAQSHLQELQKRIAELEAKTNSATVYQEVYKESYGTANRTLTMLERTAINYAVQTRISAARVELQNAQEAYDKFIKKMNAKK